MDELGPYFGGEGPRAEGVGVGKPPPLKGVLTRLDGSANIVPPLETRKCKHRDLCGYPSLSPNRFVKVDGFSQKLNPFS